MTLWKSGYSKLDANTGALITIDYPHHEIHGGSGFVTTYSALKDDTEFIEVRVQTPSGNKHAHMVFHVETALASTVEMWVDTTKTDVGGNRITPLNRNLNSADTTILTICHTPGGAQAGSADLLQYIGSASASGRTDGGGNTGGRNEFVLKANTAYLITVTSRADNNALTILLDYYEHTDRS